MIDDKCKFMKIRRVIWFLTWAVFFATWTSCGVKKYQIGDRNFKSAEEVAIWLFDTSGVHSGLYVVDADRPSSKPLIDYQSKSLFTPASNTKILTLYAALKFLPDELSGLKFLVRGDTTFIKGTGDPGFLDRRFDSHRVQEFLSDKENLIFVSDWHSDLRWGAGWSWDDYPYYYSAQLSPFPVYGNMARAWCEEGQWKLFPSSFVRNRVHIPDHPAVRRQENTNIFQMNLARCVENPIRVPFVWNQQVMVDLLRDTLHKPVSWLSHLPAGVEATWQSVSGTERDTLLRTMMYDSDNFIAEQLLMNISDQLWDTIQVPAVIDTLVRTDFGEWADEIRWVDGSGLSIYNKFSPRFIVHVLKELYNKTPYADLIRMFPAGGVRGTIESWYGADVPYVYAKTGTLSSVHCLSGFVRTNSGKTFVFSFMHNNYLGSSSLYKKKMEVLLEFLKRNY